jgi:hypothetical protein
MLLTLESGSGQQDAELPTEGATDLIFFRNLSGTRTEGSAISSRVATLCATCVGSSLLFW